MSVVRLAWLREHLQNSSNDNNYNRQNEEQYYEGYTPKNLIDKREEQNQLIQIYHYHTDHLGTPNELTDDKGKVVWLADYDAWGERVNSEALLRTSARRELCSSEVSDISCSNHYKTQFIGDIEITADDLQTIRFQGQFFDSETGLHYNRFRYYVRSVKKRLSIVLLTQDEELRSQ